MHAMVLRALGAPLEWTELPDRSPGPGEIRVTLAACGVCRTDLHVVDGELPDPVLPIIPGHVIVGRVDAIGTGVEGPSIGERVGIPWLGHTCGVCLYCSGGRENLCDRPLLTGYTRDGGFATATIADARGACRPPRGPLRGRHGSRALALSNRDCSENSRSSISIRSR
jgi:alcohol dehydrogenase, propanol-preferring